MTTLFFYNVYAESQKIIKTQPQNSTTKPKKAENKMEKIVIFLLF